MATFTNSTRSQSRMLTLFLSFSVLLVHALALPVDGGSNIIDLSSSAPESTLLQGNLTDGVPSNVSVGDIGRIDPKHYRVPDTPVTVLFQGSGAALSPEDTNAGLSAIVYHLDAQIEASGNKWLHGKLVYDYKTVRIIGSSPFPRQATWQDLSDGIRGVHQLMSYPIAQGGIGYETADFAFSVEGRTIVGHIKVESSSLPPPSAVDDAASSSSSYTTEAFSVASTPAGVATS